MRGFFPTTTGTWKLEEPPAFRRLSMSLIEMAAITGVVLRLYRMVIFDHGPTQNILFTAFAFGFGFIVLFGMATLHLGNFPVHHWVWRAPLFAVVEGATEALVSLGLIALGREPLGAATAQFADWLGIARSILIWRLVLIAVFTLLLAGVVQLVRYLLLRREHREHTLEHVAAERKSVLSEEGKQA
jgi:hypothetical protein